MIIISWDNSDLWVIGRLLYDFRCHPERSTNKRVPFYLGVCQLACHSEVCQLHIALFRQQHVGSWKQKRTKIWDASNTAPENIRCLNQLFKKRYRQCYVSSTLVIWLFPASASNWVSGIEDLCWKNLITWSCKALIRFLKAFICMIKTQDRESGIQLSSVDPHSSFHRD